MDPEIVNYHYCDDLLTRPLSPDARILVTGANGYVAHRLIPELIHRGYIVRCMFRNRRTPPILIHPRIEVVYADCLNPEELSPVLQGVHTAFYLIHSMRAKKKEFHERDARAAHNFVRAAEATGIQRIIYLGGLGEKSEGLSEHLRSRQEVGRILTESSIPAVKLRAAIIVGAGSASYELMKFLALDSRWIPFLSEFNSKCQPIAIRDVIKYLVGILEMPGLKSRVYQIGGNDVMSYKDLLLKFAGLLNGRIRFFDVSWVPVPVEWLCWIYAYWLHLFTSIPANITSLLLSSLRSDVFCREKDIADILPFEPLSFQTAVQWAQEKEAQSRVFSHWSDVPPDAMKDQMPLFEYESSDFEVDEHSIEICASPEKIFPIICRIGGKNGWAHANLLWEIRGLIDRVIGGVGLHRGRRDPDQLRVGDSVDFWRVEKLEPGRELLLRAEMISPGFSWLQFELEPIGDGNTQVTLRAHFIPKPFWGHLYWGILSKFHTYIFTGMLESFRREAAEA
ncbi:MAG: SDR family oxidoreductase [Nitrospinaceae bacterium]|jgi:uncharacterized protein YbjT (DUF2867 family)|nr:SDR family oxidoreductase [Nitrospinaceae bacterium]